MNLEIIKNHLEKIINDERIPAASRISAMKLWRELNPESESEEDSPKQLQSQSPISTASRKQALELLKNV